MTINANFLKRETLSDKAMSRVDRMVALCGKMERLISDLLNFSRLGRQAEETEIIEPATEIDEILRTLVEFMAEQNANVSIKTALPKVRMERAKLSILFRNLIVNGIRYNTSDQKHIEIGFRAATLEGIGAFQNVFYVKDNGIGIDVKHHAAIFKIFSRLNTEKAFGSGTGAGLSFVKRIIEERNCDIYLESAPGQGTTFHFTLPLASQADQLPQTRELATL